MNNKIKQAELTLIIGMGIVFSGNALADNASTYATKTGLNQEITDRKAADTTEIGLRKTADDALKLSITNIPAGPQGVKGDAGAAGAVGPQGSVGETGPAGITNTFTYSMTCGTHTPQNEACKVGTVGPGGGWIFFVDYNEQYSGFNYLEAAPTDIAVVIWCTNTSTSIPAVAGWSANAIGAGQRNTTAIIDAGCTTGAAQFADSYSTGTESDWFLGSEGEMMLMYTNLRQAGVGGFANGGYANNYYWSSTEHGPNSAWSQYFLYGNPTISGKGATLPVRAVRAF